jgi:hypothetical protein
MLHEFCTETDGADQEPHDKGQELECVRFSGLAAGEPGSITRGSPSYTVVRPISCSWGMTGTEIKLASEAAHWMQRLQMPMWYAVLADQHRPERELRGLVRELKSDIVQAKRETHGPAYWLEMAEGEPAYHANLIFPLGGRAPKRLIERIARSKLFPGDLLDIQAAPDVQGIIAYCAKERTPQAKFVGGMKLAKRLPGSHQLGAGGGDRVGLSKALKADMISAGVIQPFRRIYASRGLPALPEPLPVATAPSWSIDAKGQFSLFGQPSEIKLDTFWSGRMTPTVASEIETRRKALGWTQQELADAVGISRPQITNALAGRFGLSRQPVARLQTLLRAAS